MQTIKITIENRIPITTPFVDFQEDRIDSTFRVLLSQTKLAASYFLNKFFPFNLSISFPLFPPSNLKGRRAIACFTTIVTRGCARVYRNKFPCDVIACPNLVTECNSFYFTFTPPPSPRFREGLHFSRVAARRRGLSLRALEENDRVAKRGCESGRNFNPRLYVGCALVCRALSSVCSRNFALFYRSRDQNYETWPATFRALLPSIFASLCTFVYSRNIYIYVYIGTMWKIFGYVTSVFIPVRHETVSIYW